jgi:hypothetical protein
VLTRYLHALNSVKTPPAYTCDYTITDRGARPQESTHHMFRERGRERDEIVGFNGESLGHPEVRIFARRGDPYAVTALAPRPQGYTFTYVGVAHNGKLVNYVFDAYAQHPAAYEVTRVTVDGTTFLPVSIAFRTHTKTAEGSGEVTYRKVDRYWMPQTATARAEVNGALETEEIVWSAYQFYPNLPPATFAAPTAVIPPQQE